MAESCHSTRRTFLRSVPLAAVALSTPVIAATALETPQEKVTRLLQELQTAMKDLPEAMTVGGSCHEITFGPRRYLRLAVKKGIENSDLLIGFVPPLTT